MLVPSPFTSMIDTVNTLGELNILLYCVCPERKLVPSVTESTVPFRCITPAAAEVRSPQRSLASSPLSLPPEYEATLQHPVPKWVCGFLSFKTCSK